MGRVASWRSLSSPRRAAALVVFVVLGAVGFLPLFGGPGYEQSLASGLIVPAAAAIATALEVSAAIDLAPLACVGRGIATGAILAGVAFSTALLHGARVGICDLAGGAVFFLLTAGVGAMVGGAWGVVVAEVCRGRRRLLCVLLAIAGPLGGIAVSVARFYGSPMIFAYDPFFGYFSGALYDTVVDVRPELWTYRAGIGRDARGAGARRRRVGPHARTVCARCARGGRAGRVLAAGLVAFAVSLAITVNGPALGHWQTSTTIAEALGGRAAGPRCDVVYPDSLLADQATLLVRDCEQELAAVETRLGAHLEGRLTAFVFADANEKRRLMGAADTSIAKPWRREVYVQLAAYPHPVLGHEVAHVVSGSFARGPFRVGGGFLVPNPGLIEGIAVATSPDDDELTDAQWARAMLDLGTLPEIRGLFSLEFLGASAQKSYTVAGAFVGWVLDRWGPATVRAWYGGGSIEALTGESWSSLDDEFRAWLRTLPMPAEALAYARARFERPSVWARKCPHVVDALDRDGDKCRDEHRLAKADALYARALASDPRDYHARFARAKMAAQSLDVEGAARGRGRARAARRRRRGASNVARPGRGGHCGRRSRARAPGLGRRGLPRDRRAHARRRRGPHAGGQGAGGGRRAGASRRGRPPAGRARARSGSVARGALARHLGRGDEGAPRRLPRRQEPDAARPLGARGRSSRTRSIAGDAPGDPGDGAAHRRASGASCSARRALAPACSATPRAWRA